MGELQLSSYDNILFHPVDISVLTLGQFGWYRFKTPIIKTIIKTDRLATELSRSMPRWEKVAPIS